MSVKRRILISNLIMLVFLLALVLILSFYVIRVFLFTYIQNDVKSLQIPDESVSSVSVYELQILFDGVIDISNESGIDFKKNEDFVIVDKYIKSTNSKCYVIINSIPIYVSGGESVDEIYTEATKLNPSLNQNEDIIFYSDANSFIYFSAYQTSSGEPAEVLLFNNELGTNGFRNENSKYWKDAANNVYDAVQTIAILGCLVIVIISLVLMIALSKGIMGPLNKLRAATKKISDGDLDFEIDYSGSDEISEVLRDFEIMRVNLAELNEKQRVYEEDRKEMIAGISHDLRTPLTSIKGYVSGLMDGIADSPEKQQKYLTTIYNTAVEMDKLVDDLFLFSKLDLDKIPFDFEHVELGNYMFQCCEELKFSMEKKMMSMSFVNLCNEDIYVRLDRDQFARVLINIAENSAKYKKNEIGSFFVVLSMQNNEALIALKDDGQGVESSLAGKIFDSFYRNDPARTNPVKGSGLGLSIAKQIVSSHGGKIWAESNLGEGLTVYISLPIDGEIIK